MIYDIKAREKLSKFVKSIGAINRIRSNAAGNNGKGVPHQELEKITQEALTLLKAYQVSPETSAQAQFEYLEQLLKPLKIYRASYMSEKSWWQKTQCYRS